MKNLFFIAQDQNADELFATIESDHFENPTLMQLKNQYENAQIEDKEFCDKVLDYLKPPSFKTFVVVMTIREDWDSPNIFITKALTEEDATDEAERNGNFEEGEFDQGIENGEISIHVKEVR